jgi:nicotinate-nucleotide pyrophosphorylase
MGCDPDQEQSSRAAGESRRRAWQARKAAAFIEVEVRTEQGAIAGAEEFRRMQESSQDEPGSECPCLLLLDNMPASAISETIAALRSQGLLESVLTEASGNISPNNIGEYAACGADAISIGALTHSARALDLCERLQVPEEKP